MPIYTFKCKCGTQADYLLKIGKKPDYCLGCDEPRQERVYSGQTFAAFMKGAKSTPKETADNCRECPLETKCEPGVAIAITGSLDHEGKLSVRVDRIQADGTIDASVTGTKDAIDIGVPKIPKEQLN